MAKQRDVTSFTEERREREKKDEIVIILISDFDIVITFHTRTHMNTHIHARSGLIHTDELLVTQIWYLDLGAALALLL